jgi:hypothetical protein
VTDNGVLTSGTLVVITDGEDTNNETTTPGLAGTLVNVISFGVSTDIQGSTLSAIGRDGAFLATTEESRTLAFSSIAKRVKEHPERTYLLGYCSAASSGTHKVSITLADQTITTEAASCGFDAKLFGGDACSTDVFANSCSVHECGTIFACGACAKDECCSGGSCSDPTPPADCRGVNSLCPEDKRCAEVQGSTPLIYSCVPALISGDDCTGSTSGLCGKNLR